jgi:uncharacterized protein YuzE
METIVESRTVQAVTQAIPLLLDFSKKRFWVDYDQEADVLYISFRRPQRASDTQMTEDGLLLRYHGKELIGITVLEASTRAQSHLGALVEPKSPAPQKPEHPGKKRAGGKPKSPRA